MTVRTTEERVKLIEKNCLYLNNKTLDKAVRKQMVDGIRREAVSILNDESWNKNQADWYQTQAMRSSAASGKPGKEKEELYHAIFGLTSEAGECAGILQKVYQGHGSPFEDKEVKEHLKKELGDVLWMVAEAADALDLKLSDVMDTNIEKLRARYPHGFEMGRSLHRKAGDI